MSEVIAQSYDIDDTLVSREPGYHFQVSAVSRHIRRKPRIVIPDLSEVPELHREIVNAPVEGVREGLSYFFHKRRDTFPHVAQTLYKRTMEGKHIYANTGRKAKQPWVDITEETFYRGYIDAYVRDVFYTPIGVHGLVSKIDAVKRLRKAYDRVEHFDDNPADAIPIAALFPDVNVYIISNASTGLLFSRAELEQYPNVRRIARIGQETDTV